MDWKYDHSYATAGWFDPMLTAEGWFDDEAAASEGGEPPEAPAAFYFVGYLVNTNAFQLR